jgi:hypothetical protein
MPDLDALFQRLEPQLEDFWNRRHNAPRDQTEFQVFGCPVVLESNQPDALACGALCASYFSTAPPRERPAFKIQLVVQEGGPNDALPRDLYASNQFSGSKDWLMLRAGPWGMAFADLAAGEAVVVVSAPLGADPDVLSRGLLNTILLNFITRHGFSMLHATGLVRNEHALLLLAPHNTGKSTTALRLVLGSDYRLMSDSMVYVSDRAGQKELAGFPVGRIKLRRDMLASFPDIRAQLVEEQVRDETKFVGDLRALAPDQVLEAAIRPSAVTIGLLSQSGGPQTEIREMKTADLWPAIIANSLHADQRSIWETNLSRLEALVNRARALSLAIGTDPEGILAAVDRLA